MKKRLADRLLEKQRADIAFRTAQRLPRHKFPKDVYRMLLVAQNGAYAICQESPERDVRLAIDHDHATGRVRGLLCRRCNVALGSFHDNAFVVLRAAAYLERTNIWHPFHSDRLLTARQCLRDAVNTRKKRRGAQ